MLLLRHILNCSVGLEAGEIILAVINGKEGEGDSFLCLIWVSCQGILREEKKKAKEGEKRGGGGGWERGGRRERKLNLREIKGGKQKHGPVVLFVLLAPSWLCITAFIYYSD